MQPRAEFSFEFFPPRSEQGQRRFWRTVGNLETFDPSFFSITYGALGTAQEASIDAVLAAAGEGHTPIAAHLTHEGSTIAEINSVAEKFAAAGVSRIVALRGDAREDAELARQRGPCYQSVAEMIQGLLSINEFDISVAAYPETHPKAVSATQDIDELKKKLDAGANRAITQFFFDPDDYDKLRERMASRGVFLPLTAGVLPIRNFAKVCEFAAKCGARVPQRLHRKFSTTLDSEQLASNEMEWFIEQLQQRGCHQFHIYTLNQPVSVRQLYRQPRLDTAAA